MRCVVGMLCAMCYWSVICEVCVGVIWGMWCCGCVLPPFFYWVHCYEVLLFPSHLPCPFPEHWVNCWLSVGTGRLVKNHNVRTSYCLLKPSDFERHQITVLLDPFSRSGVRRHNYQRRLHNTKNSGNFRKDEEPVSEEGMIKLMDMRLLNQLPTKAHREHFGWGGRLLALCPSSPTPSVLPLTTWLNIIPPLLLLPPPPPPPPLHLWPVLECQYLTQHKVMETCLISRPLPI